MKTTNSKRIFRLIQSVEKILPNTGLVPESLNPRIKQARDVTSLVELLWDAFHEEDALEGWSKVAQSQRLDFDPVEARKQFREKASILPSSAKKRKKEKKELFEDVKDTGSSSI